MEHKNRRGPAGGGSTGEQARRRPPTEPSRAALSARGLQLAPGPRSRPLRRLGCAAAGPPPPDLAGGEREGRGRAGEEGRGGRRRRREERGRWGLGGERRGGDGRGWGAGRG